MGQVISLSEYRVRRATCVVRKVEDTLAGSCLAAWLIVLLAALAWLFRL